MSREDKHIDNMIDSLRNAPTDLKNVDSMQLNKEEDYAGFLGIDLHHDEDGSIELLQVGLIDKVIKALNLDHNNTSTKDTPTAESPLLKDSLGPPIKEV